MLDKRTGEIRELDKKEKERLNKVLAGEVEEFNKMEEELRKEDKVIFMKKEIIEIKGCQFCVIEIDTKLNTITLMSTKLIKRKL